MKKNIQSTVTPKTHVAPKGKPVQASKPPVKPSTATPKGPKTEAVHADEVQDKPAASGANTGKRTGLRVMKFQDLTFQHNDTKVRPAPFNYGPGQRTDEELAAEWCAEFPNSRAVRNGRITADMVRAVRHLYNNGTGDHGIPGQTNDSRPWVIDAKGNRVQAEYTRTRKPEAKAEAPETQGAARKTQPAAPAAKVASKKTAEPQPQGKRPVVLRKKHAA